MSKPEEYWQLYNELGLEIQNKNIGKKEVFEKAILHGASHVWIWRKNTKGAEIMLQKRAAQKPTWPSYLDISAAGHIDNMETPLQAAIRETSEELGIHPKESDLKLVGVQRMFFRLDNGWTENEYQWLYLLRLNADKKFELQDTEVESTIWKLLEEFKHEFADPKKKYVPHGEAYYLAVIEAVEREITLV